MEGGNGVSETSVVTLCLNYAYQKTQSKTFPGRGRIPQNKKAGVPSRFSVITFASLTPTGLHPWLA